MPGNPEQSFAYLGVAGKLLGPVDEPQLKAVFHGAQVAGQLSVVTLGIVHQVAGMHLEKTRQHHA